MTAVLHSVPFNTAVQAAGRVLVMILGLVSVALTSRYLGQEAYGDLTTIVVYVSFFAALADLGLSSIAVREMSGAPHHIDAILGNVLTLRMLLGIGAVVLAIGGIAFSPYPATVKVGVAIAALSIPFGNVWLTFASVFPARLEMLPVAAVEVGSRAVALVLTVATIVLGGGFYLLVGATVAWSVTGALFMALLARRVARVRLLGDVSHWRELMREALPLGAATVLQAIYLRIDTILLSLLRGSSDVGVYGVACKVFELTLALPAFFAISLFPVLSRIATQDRAQLPSMLQRAFDVLLIAALPVTAGGVLVAPGIASLVGGPDFAEAGRPLALLLLGTVFAFENTLLSSALVALRRQQELPWLGLAGVTVNVLLNLLVIPRFGAAGAAATTTVSAIVMFLVLLSRVGRGSDFAPSLRIAAKAAIAAGLMLLALWPLASAHPLLLVALGAAAYAFALYLLGGMSREQLMLTSS